MLPESDFGYVGVPKVVHTPLTAHSAKPRLTWVWAYAAQSESPAFLLQCILLGPEWDVTLVDRGNLAASISCRRKVSAWPIPRQVERIGETYGTGNTNYDAGPGD